MYRNLLLLLVAVTLLSCQFRHKVVEEKYPDGSPKRVCIYLGKGENRTLVEETLFYPNKQIQITGEFKDNRRHGHWVSYYENGQLWSDGYFTNGMAHGKRSVYYPSGKLRYEGNYINDQMAGKWKFYEETGNLVREVDYGTP